MLLPSSVPLPWCEQRNKHPPILVWATPALSSATQKGQGADRSRQCQQRGVKGNGPLFQGAAPCSSDPPIRDLRKETRLLLMTLL